LKVKSALKFLTERLSQIEEKDYARFEALCILAHFLKTSPLNVFLFLEKEVSEEEIRQILELRLSRFPLAYILKEAWFWGRKFFVEEGVLIPRQDTELLVEVFLESGIREGWILELGLGSGAVTITLLLERPDLKAAGIELSCKALEVCCKNAELHGVKKRFFPVKGDWLSPLSPAQLFSAIISNPPYISEKEWSSLPEEVKREPYEALIAGKTGLEFHERLIAEARDFLIKGGFLFFEIGYNQKQKVEELLKKYCWKYQFYRDLSGHYRVVKAWRDEDLRG